jgi:hypothetical protein
MQLELIAFSPKSESEQKSEKRETKQNDDRNVSTELAQPRKKNFHWHNNNKKKTKTTAARKKHQGLLLRVTFTLKPTLIHTHPYTYSRR